MKRLLFLSIVLTPILFAQKREDILSIQRDVANLQDQVRQLQKSQDEKMAALQAMLQQTVDASVKLAGGLTNLQRDVDKKLSDQQGALVAPVAATNTKIDQMSDDFRGVAINVAELVRRVNTLDTKLADIKSLLQAMQTPIAPPAPLPGQTAAVPSGPSAETLWENARRDQSSGKLEMAMDEYQSYVKNFDKTENAPAAQYQVGYLYFQAEQYEDAVKAFDMVLEHWAENPKTQEALYYKAVALQKAKHPTDAGKTYREYLTRYSHGEHVAQAHQNLRTLGMESSPRSTSKKRP
jgi:TolA-binding protein